MGDLNNEEKGYDFSKFKSKNWYIPHMYGIELPKYITDKKINEDKEKKLWMDAVQFQTKNIMVEFEKYEGYVSDMVGYEEINVHLVFDMKLSDNFRRK